MALNITQLENGLKTEILNKLHNESDPGQDDKNQPIYKEFIRFQESCARQQSDQRLGVNGWDQLIRDHANALAKILSEILAQVIAAQVNIFVRSAEITPEKFAIAKNSILTEGTAKSQTGPQNLVPLAKGAVTLDVMNK